MNGSKRLLSLALCLALLLAALPCAFAEEAPATGTRRLRLGSSIYTLEIDKSYEYGPMSDDEIADDMKAYLYSDKLDMDFDVYQFGKAGIAGGLEDYVYQEAGWYESTIELVPSAEINGIPVGWYRTTEEYDGEFYETITYILDNGDEYVDVVFWLDSDDELAQAQATMATLAYVKVNPIQLGTSPYYVVGLSSFVQGEVTEEDAADDQVAYWFSEETLLEFNVYQFSKASAAEQNLADYVKWEADHYENVIELVPETTVNDIPVGWYRTTEPKHDGVDYETVTVVIDAGDEFLDLVFWLDGQTAQEEANAMLQSLFVMTDEDEDDEDAAPAASDDQSEADELKEGMNAFAGAVEEEETEEEEEETEEEPEEAAEEAVEAAAPEAAAEPEGDAAEAGETYPLQLGTSPFWIDVPVGFVPGEVTEEDIADDQVAYYYSEKTLLDFDVYQFSKDGYPDNLAEYAAEESDGYTAVSELVTDGEINGVPAAWYRTVEEYDEAEYETLTYILDGGGEYVDLVFWLDGDNAEAEAAAIVNTLSVDQAAWAQNVASVMPEANAPEGDVADEAVMEG